MRKTAIITGAGGNLGRALVEKFLKEGFRVAGTVTAGNTDTARNNPEFESHLVDLANESAAEEFVAATIKKYNSIDVAMLTAGGFMAGKISETKSAQLSEQYKLNFETAYHVARPVFLKMLQQGFGRIFLIGARAGIGHEPGKETIAYGLSKSLLFRLAEMMNEEAAGKNIVVSVIVPGIIDTAQNRQAMPQAVFSDWVTAEDIAGTIHFYCSKEAASIREPVIKLYNKI